MLIVEKIIGDIIVIEDGKSHFEIPRTQTQPDIKEGDILTLTNGIYKKNQAATRKRRLEILALQEKTFDC